MVTSKEDLLLEFRSEQRCSSKNACHFCCGYLTAQSSIRCMDLNLRVHYLSTHAPVRIHYKLRGWSPFMSCVLTVVTIRKCMWEICLKKIFNFLDLFIRNLSNWKTRRKRKRGRPRKTWMEGVQTAMTTRNLGSEQWKNREEWRLVSGRRRQLLKKPDR